jgi:hypothetical protein
MKTLITSLMALTLSIGAVNANDSVVNSKKANTTASVEANSISLENYQQLLAENKLLKEKVAELGNSTAEMQSTIEYNNMMYNMLTKLRTDANAEEAAEAEATISYQKMMSAVLLNLKKGK